MPADPLSAFPVHNARLRGGRKYHRIRTPQDWAGEVQTACEKRGYLAHGRPTATPGRCPICYPAASQAAA